jgi:sulfur-oxidizing protein SoxA
MLEDILMLNLWRKPKCLVMMINLMMPIMGMATEIPVTVPLDLDKPTYTVPWKRYSAWSQTDWSNYSNLRQEIARPISFIQHIEIPLQGNPENGKKLISDKKKGNCAACHLLPDEKLPGNVGINISTVGTWQRTDEYLFNYLYDPRIYNPTTVMPPWGAYEVLTKAEIRDVAAYLKTLTQPVKFTDPLENPDKRPIPVENRDNLDELENPAMFAVDQGKKLYNQPGPLGKSCQDCHDNPATSFSTWAVQMPKVEPRLNKVIGIEEFVTRHARATTGAEYLAQSAENLALAIYLRYLANGQVIAIDKNDANIRIALRRGEKLMERKIGQLNLACNDCHHTSANKWLRGQYLGDFVGMLDHFPTYRTSRTEIWDIRKRFQWCNVSVRANELPPDAPEYGDIELYLTAANNGRTLSVPGIRH